ncbi:putative TetR family transcriptional regulator [Actinacidiphila reveromycinica]|uniref:Putative TetR family transcriptional regulator n=1 Tax=Actinacidiphila reveromycinica TaxID=659352 RepID=A0A7U3UYH0_9ACTN|nr:TetR/AcrR family transcriptional regulator [Streptomyces sp. SN-593]BBB00894.1 putative TetR family transcriptional regulator [Streptomyces sp. SN-593]
MAKRGEELRNHILWAAKDVFLEMGFERASMDVVAARAETSKRSLYAHFESKDNLFLAVVDLVRERYLGRLGTPADYGEDTAEATVLFCGRLVQMLLWTPTVRTCRLGISEAGRFPEAAAGYHDAVFATAHDRLAAFLAERLRRPPEAGAALAEELIGRTVYPLFTRALFGVTPSRDASPDPAEIARHVDLTPIREAVAAALP